MTELTMEKLCAALDVDDAAKFDYKQLQSVFGKNQRELLQFMIVSLDGGCDEASLQAMSVYQLAMRVNTLLRSESGRKAMKPSDSRCVLLRLARENKPRIFPKVAKLIRATDAEIVQFNAALVSHHASLMRANHFRTTAEISLDHLFERWE